MSKCKTFRKKSRKNAKRRRSIKKKMLMGGGKGYQKYTILDDFNNEMIHEKNKDTIYLFFDKTIYSIASAGFGGILNTEKILKDKNNKIFETQLDNIIKTILQNLRIEIDNNREEYRQLLERNYYEIQGLSFGIGIFMNNTKLYNEKIKNLSGYIVIKASIIDLIKLYPYLPDKQSISSEDFQYRSIDPDQYYSNERTGVVLHKPSEMPDYVQSSNVLTPDNPHLSLGDQIRAEQGIKTVHK